MKATPHRVASVLLLAGFSISMAAETRIQPQIESVGLFKNGVAVVRAAFTVPGPGSYCWENIPQTIHGTFEVSGASVRATTKSGLRPQILVSGAPVLTVRATRRLVEEERPTGQPGMRDELAGKDVTVTLNGEPGQATATLQGRVMETPAILSTPDFSTRYPESNPYGRYYGWPGFGTGERAASPGDIGNFMILETAAGREYVSRQHVRSISVAGPFDPVKRRVEKPVMVFVTSGGGRIQLTYLARGMAWLPSYTVDISDPAKLAIRQSAVVRNELMDIKDTALDLISGYPNIKFSHVDSPLNPETSLAAFFQQLNSNGNSAPSTMSQMVSFNSMAPAAANTVPLNPESGPDGADIHYQSVGKRDLLRGDSLSLAIAAGSTPYTRIVEWVVPDSRDPNGRRNNNNRENPDLPNPEDQPWDALQFTNPFKFPMTTAPASIVESGKFRGQSLSQWVNPGQTATLRVTQALSIRAQASEIEEPNSRTNPKPENIITFLGNRHLRLTIHGTLRMHNFRSSEVPMVIRCRFSGELINADAEPTTTLLNEGNGINPRSELGWKIPLKPGEEKNLKYSYHVWIPY
jgi:hypothetical protein